MEGLQRLLREEHVTAHPSAVEGLASTDEYPSKTAVGFAINTIRVALCISGAHSMSNSSKPSKPLEEVMGRAKEHQHSHRIR